MADKNSTALRAIGVRTMSSRELATIADKRHDNVMRVCRDLRDAGVCPQIEETPYIEPSNGQTYQECMLNQRDSYVAMARLSPEFTARLVDRWHDLEPIAVQAGGAIEAVAVADALANMLRLDGSARLGMARKALEITAPHLLALAPVYAIDAPTGSTAGSSETTASLTTLLKRHGHKVSAAACNVALRDLGILEAKTRPSTKGVAYFWSLTDAGLRYGKNVSSPKNQRETQPHWYESKFGELAHLLRIEGAQA
jgi:hypothetical protein